MQARATEAADGGARLVDGGRSGGAVIHEPRSSAAMVAASEAAAEGALRDAALRRHSKEEKRERRSARQEVNGHAGVAGRTSRAHEQGTESGLGLGFTARAQGKVSG